MVGLASDAAAVALNAGKQPSVALEFLELGRGVLAASLEELRTDVSELRQRYPELAEKFIRLRNELDLPVVNNTLILNEDPTSSSWQAQANRRYEAGNELDELVADIRTRPGLDDFLCAPSEEETRAAARWGPIVIINVSEYRCDAILVEQHQIRSLALPDLNSTDIKTKAQMGDLGRIGVLEWLWNVVAGPVLGALGFTEPPNEDWPHVWWIPTGALSRFPLHAAGYHSKPSTEAVLDRVMSSYSSSIRASIHGRRRRHRGLQSTPTQALLIAMENTPEHSRLPSTTKEISMLHRLCESMGLQPVEPKRCKQDVLACLSDCQIFHFAGHGHADSADPSQSYLLLDDWQSDQLTVASLLETNLRDHPPFLAYLSACGTGRIRDERFVDESIHLISACQLAGFRHVIGTLWEVNDELCIDMARITYEWMRDTDITDDSVCRGLHKATRELRGRWLDVLANRRGRSRSAAPDMHTAFAVGNGDNTRNASDGDRRDSSTWPRDVVLFDDDDDEGAGPLLWVPYVHFGI